MYNLEDISLKIMRILYQLSQQSSTNKADLSLLEHRFSFTDREEGTTLIQESLQSLNLLGLVSFHQEDNNTVYKITQKGQSFYKQFKYLMDLPKEPGCIIIQGDWTGNNHNYHNITQSGKEEIFPGDSVEFLAHYTDIMKEVEELTILIHQKHKDKDILERVTNIKNIINSNIERVERESPWISKLEKFSSRIEDQLKTLNKHLEKQMAYQ